MSERSKYLTVIVSDPTKEEASALIGHPKMSAASWSHAIEDRDAKDAEIAELRDSVRRAEQSWINWQNRCEFTEQERDEARECVRRLYAALQPFANTVPIEPTGLITGLMREDFSNAVSALAATPEHLR